MPFVRGFGIWELLIILVIGMMVFGVGKLPQVGGAIGKSIREFRKGQTEGLEAKKSGESSANTPRRSKAKQETGKK